LRFESSTDAARLTAPAGLSDRVPAVAAATWIVAGSGSPADGGAFADGSDARFNSPAGIALASDGSLVVADAGNRRIRLVRGDDRRFPLDADRRWPPPRGSLDTYRIAYVGNSAVWWDTTWSTSIPGLAERALAPAVAAQTGKALELYAVRFIGAKLDAFASYVETLADTRLIDAVVLQLGDDALPVAGPLPPAVRDQTVRALSDVRTRLRADGVALLAGGMPSDIGIAPVEGTYLKLQQDALRPEFPGDEAAWNGMFRDAGIPSYDLWAAYRTEIAARRHEAIITSEDVHPTPHGRELIARAIEDALLRERPWSPSAGG